MTSAILWSTVLIWPMGLILLIWIMPRLAKNIFKIYFAEKTLHLKNMLGDGINSTKD